MQISIWKIIKRLLLLSLLAGLIFIVNLIWFRPFFISHFYEKIFIEFAWKNPQLLTDIGIGWKNDQLDDNSFEAAEAQLALLRKDYKQLLQYDRGSLSDQEALSYDILRFYLQDQIDGVKYQHHQYTVTQRGGAYQGLINFMRSTHPLQDIDDAEDYLSRVAQMGLVLDNSLKWVSKERDMGVIPPDFIIQKILENLHNIRDVVIQKHPLVEHFTAKLTKLALEKDKRQQLEEQLVESIINVVNPAYDRQIAFFENLLSIANSEAGVWKLPDGDDYYQYRIQTMTTTDYTAEQLHQLGLDEVKRITSEMHVVLSDQGYTDGTVGERMQQLNTEPRFLYADTEAGRAKVIEDYESIISDIEQGMDEVFDIRPKASVVVRRVPEYRQKTAAGGSYLQPAQDGSRPGVFYANLYDIKATPKWGMKTLAYHEAIPGHHFQIAIQTELTGLPMFRNFLRFTSYSEGWALYAERLAWEYGYQQEPFGNLGRLQAELMRAVRLVVDTGIHHKRWSREQAIKYMVTATGIALSDVESEIERYIVWPGQALAYKVGMLKILELRQKAQDQLGQRFDIRQFHNVVLKNGPVPLVILEELVDDYIKQFHH